MDREVLREMEKALEENKTLETLELSDDCVTLPKEFCRHVLFGVKRNKSLFDVYLSFNPQTWYCPDDGRLVCQSRIV